MTILIITNVKGDTRDLYKIDQSLLEKIKQVAKGWTVLATTETDSKVSQKIAAADILISSEMSVLNDKNSKNLKWVHLTSAGMNKLPDYLQHSDILVTNSSGVHPVPIGEHVFALMLMLVRKINLAFRIQIKKKEWIRSYEYYQPEELFGKKLLIVGMGRIGERIAILARAFGMEVSGIVRDLNKNRRTKVKLFGLKDLVKAVKEADFIVNCLPGTEFTKWIFDLRLFKNFKPAAYFINIGRGTTAVEADLIFALEKRIIKGAGLDVFEVEPLPKSSKLWDLENVIITPHYSGWNPNYTERVIDIFIENLNAYLKGKKLPNLIDKKLGY